MARGRKEGSLSGKRPIFWVCISSSQSLIVEKIYSSSEEEDIKNFSEEKASKIFLEKFGKTPDQIIGPCYDVKSFAKEKIVNQPLNKKNNINSSNTAISSVLGLGYYNGWSGTVFSISRNSKEVLFIASERLDANHNMILPPAAPIKKELITFV